MSYVVEVVFFTEQPIRRVRRGKAEEKTPNFLQYRGGVALVAAGRAGGQGERGHPPDRR